MTTIKPKSDPLTGVCPICGKTGLFTPHPEKPGRIVLICDCNPAGPVIETDAPKQHQEV